MKKCYLCEKGIVVVYRRSIYIENQLCPTCYQKTRELMLHVDNQVYKSIKDALVMEATLNQAIMMQCGRFNLPNEAVRKIESELQGE